MSKSRKRGQRGIAKRTTTLLYYAISVIDKLKPLTVRGVCYQMFVAKLLGSMAKNDTAKISRLLVYAREIGLVPWEFIVDETRLIEREAQWKDVAEYCEIVKRSYRRDFWAYQPYNLQVWSEKATVGGILRPVIEEYGVSFLAIHGFNSATKIYEAAQNTVDDERKTIILYVGDRDPSGMYMSDVDLPVRLKRYGGRFTLRRIALTAADVSQNRLPSFDAKVTDPRYRWYRSRYGDRAWELDAMDPNVLRERVKKKILGYVDTVSWQRQRLVEAVEKESIKKVVNRMMAG